eukprot:scaffold90577_cov59-Phaeocystis_antarctica.AAC.2
MGTWKTLRAARPFFLMAGPNVIESRAHLRKDGASDQGHRRRPGLPLVSKASIVPISYIKWRFFSSGEAGTLDSINFPTLSSLGLLFMLCMQLQ